MHLSRFDGLCRIFMETTRSSKGGEEYEKWKEIKDSQKLFHTRREREREGEREREKWEEMKDSQKLFHTRRERGRERQRERERLGG